MEDLPPTGQAHDGIDRTASATGVGFTVQQRKLLLCLEHSKVL